MARFHSSSHNEKGLPTSSPEEAKDLIKRLYDKIEKNKDKIVKYKTFDVDGSDYLLIAFGGAVRAARQSCFGCQKEDLKWASCNFRLFGPFRRNMSAN